MRYLSKYESHFDVDQAMVKIGKEFGKDRVRDMVSAETKEWSDGYEQFGNGEAEEHVICALLSWYERSTGKSIDEAQTESLEAAIRAHYNI